MLRLSKRKDPRFGAGPFVLLTGGLDPSAERRGQKIRPPPAADAGRIFWRSGRQGRADCVPRSPRRAPQEGPRFPLPRRRPATAPGHLPVPAGLAPLGHGLLAGLQLRDPAGPDAIFVPLIGLSQWTAAHLYDICIVSRETDCIILEEAGISNGRTCGQFLSSAGGPDGSGSGPAESFHFRQSGRL